jgi:3-oxoacyl-[acyl-carrier protein] reductase
MRTILVVGGSKGIGLAIVKNEVEASSVVSISRHKSGFEHKNLRQIELDVLADDFPEIEKLNSIIYCPGSINLKPFSKLTEDDFMNDYRINVLGAIKVIKHYLPKLSLDNESSILLFSTVATVLGMPFHASIASAKAAVEGLTKSLAADLAPKIRVNAIAPTLTDTELASKILRNDKMKEAIADRHPLKKYLEPKNVADMASFLISEKASSITGQIIRVDCGIVSLKL